MDRKGGGGVRVIGIQNFFVALVDRGGGVERMVGCKSYKILIQLQSEQSRSFPARVPVFSLTV